MAVSHLKCPFATQIPPAMAMMTISRCPPRSVRSTPPPKGRIGLQGVSQREILTICWRIWHYTNGNTHNGNAIIGWHPNMLEILHVWYIYQQNWVILDRGKCWDSYSSTMLRRWGCFSASSFEKVYSVFLIEYVQVSKGLNKHLFFWLNLQFTMH